MRRFSSEIPSVRWVASVEDGLFREQSLKSFSSGFCRGAGLERVLDTLAE